jgi:hypothetical protein
MCECIPKNHPHLRGERVIMACSLSQSPWSQGPHVLGHRSGLTGMIAMAGVHDR